ncbi:MAG: alpha/beta fold hydrolase [Alphaproteobacteria bacterium]|nr:alpha/beta fold hydrolase [Alphaproteobacteria bacterium]
MVKQSTPFNVTIDGRRLAAVRIDGPKAPPLVFLHEALGSIAQWRDFPAALCATAARPGLVYERFGHGHSGPMAGPRTPAYLHEEAATLVAVLDALQIQRADLVGHSDGGSIALLAAARHPARVGRIATMAAHVLVEDVTLAGIRAAQLTYAGTDMRERLARYHGEGTDALFRAWAETWLSPAFRGWNIEKDIRVLDVPVLALQGEADEYGTLDQLARIKAAVRGPCATWAVPKAAHHPHFQARAEVLDRLAAFFKV